MEEYETGVDDFNAAFPACKDLLTALVSCKRSDAAADACSRLQGELRCVVAARLRAVLTSAVTAGA